MPSSMPANISCIQAQDMQRQLESTVLKMEKAGLLQKKSADHIRVIVAEGIAEHFGDRYRGYPSVPRPDNVPIRRDLIPNPCVLAAQPRMKRSTKVSEPVTAGTDASSPAKTVTSTSRGAARRVSAWAVGVANASSASASPETSISYETHRAATSSRGDAATRDDPTTLSPPAVRGSYALSERKTEERAVSGWSIKDENTSVGSSPVAVEAAVVKTAPIVGQPAVKTEDSDLDSIFCAFARTTPPGVHTLLLPTANTATETVDTSDWLIGLSP